MNEPAFAWPGGRRAALSLTFDDARPSQIDAGLPILDRHRVRATFYVSFTNLERRLEAWKAAAAAGHEIGNHTVSHPCSANFRWSRNNGLEEFTLPRMERELTDAGDRIEQLLGMRPTTFAYPCGQTWVGRGEQVRSYVPLVARHFRIGRGYPDEAANNPAVCDLARVNGIGIDGAAAREVIDLVEHAVAEGEWLVLIGHDVDEGGRQTVLTETLEAVCRYCADHEKDVWADTVDRVGAYLEDWRAGGRRK